MLSRAFRCSLALVLISLMFSDVPTKVRGKISDYERSHKVLVVYVKNKSPEARTAIREAGFTVSLHEPRVNAFRCRWTGGRNRIQGMLTALAKSPSIQLIEPER